jgi:hypothetical protein
VDHEDAAAVDHIEQLVSVVVGMQRDGCVRRQHHQLSAQFFVVEELGQNNAFRPVRLVGVDVQLAKRLDHLGSCRFLHCRRKTFKVF